MKAGKWNYDKKRYEAYEIPEDWRCPLTVDDFAEEVNCAACGKKMAFGGGYTSLEIHTAIGFGYCVCGECHIEEVKRKLEFEERD